MMLKHVALVVALLATASCGGNGEDEQPTMAPTAPTSQQAQAETVSPSPAPSSSGQASSGQASSAQPPRVRPSLAPPATFLPTSDNVKEAFLAALMTTYYQTPQGPAREQWVAGEQQKVYGIQVASCSASTAGTASTCQVRFNGVSTTIKVMLTQSGWRLVP